MDDIGKHLTNKDLLFREVPQTNSINITQEEFIARQVLRPPPQTFRIRTCNSTGSGSRGQLWAQ